MALAAHAAGAAESDVVVAVDCPAYDAESRAALEARARAELIVRAAMGTLVVACRGERAELTWHPLVGPPETANVTLTPEPRASIERVLEALDGVLATPSANAGQEGSTEAEPIAAPVPAAPPNPPLPTPAAGSAPERADAVDALGPRARARSTWPGVVVGAAIRGELWARTAAVGPNARVEVTLPLKFAAFLSASGLWALSSPEGVDARLVRLAAGGAVGIGTREWLRVGVDAFVDLIHAEASGAGSDDRVVGGATIYANAALPVGPLRLEVGPTLSIHPREVQVLVGDVETLHVPAIAVGLLLGAAVGPLR